MEETIPSDFDFRDEGEVGGGASGSFPAFFLDLGLIERSDLRVRRRNQIIIIIIMINHNKNPAYLPVPAAGVESSWFRVFQQTATSDG